MKAALATLPLVALLLPAPAAAQMPARDTADVLPPGRWSVGLVDPLRLGLAGDLELAVHPLLLVAGSPNVLVRRPLGRAGPVRITGEVGAYVPTLTMRLTQGYFFPSWETSSARVGWFLVPRAGLAASLGEAHVTTARFEASAGLPLGRNDALPLDSYAPLELATAAALTGHLLHLGLQHDHALAPWLRARGGLDLWHTGAADPPRSRYLLAAWFGLEAAASRAVRIGTGAILYDYDQRRTVVEREDGRWHRVAVRSRDVWPTLEVIVAP